jgi:hypothetical protein
MLITTPSYRRHCFWARARPFHRRLNYLTPVGMEVLERDYVRQRERDCEVGTCLCKTGGLATVLSPRRFGASLR